MNYNIKTRDQVHERAAQAVLWYLETFDRQYRGEETMTPTLDMPCRLDTSWSLDGYSDSQRVYMFSVVTAEIIRKRETSPINPNPDAARLWLAALRHWAV